MRRQQLYVPTFASSLKAEIDLLLDNSACTKLRRPDPSLSIAENHRRLCAAANVGDNAEYLAYRFMDWGETTDNVIAHLFLEDGVASIPFSFWRKEHHDPAELGEVFVAELPERELLRLIHETAWTLALGLR